MLHCQRVTNHCITYCNWPWKCQRFKTGCAVPKRFCSHCHRYRSTCATRQRSSFVESATFLLDAWRCQTWSYEQLGECCIVLVVSAQSHFSASDFGVHTAASIKAAKQHGRVRFWAGWRQSEAARDTQDVRLLARCLHELVNCARGMGQHRHEGFTPTIWHIMAHQFFFPMFSADSGRSPCIWSGQRAKKERGNGAGTPAPAPHPEGATWRICGWEILGACLLTKPMCIYIYIYWRTET